MKHYIKQIKPYIEPPCLQGFNNTPIPVEGYDWVSEDLEEELIKNIVVKDPWSTLIFKERFIEENKTCDGCVHVGEGLDISGSTCYLCKRNPVDHRIDWFEEERELDVYEGDNVVVRPPWDIREIEGYSGAFCKCGHVLHIKTPKTKGYRTIKCPECGFVISLFCGDYGEKLDMNYFR